jgi:hypothetical protein
LGRSSFVGLGDRSSLGRGCCLGGVGRCSVGSSGSLGLGFGRCCRFLADSPQAGAPGPPIEGPHLVHGEGAVDAGAVDGLALLVQAAHAGAHALRERGGFGGFRFAAGNRGGSPPRAQACPQHPAHVRATPPLRPSPARAQARPRQTRRQPRRLTPPTTRPHLGRDQDHVDVLAEVYAVALGAGGGGAGGCRLIEGLRRGRRGAGKDRGGPLGRRLAGAPPAAAASSARASPEGQPRPQPGRPRSRCSRNRGQTPVKPVKRRACITPSRKPWDRPRVAPGFMAARTRG